MNDVKTQQTAKISLEWHGIFVVSVFRNGFKEIGKIIDVDDEIGQIDTFGILFMKYLIHMSNIDCGWTYTLCNTMLTRDISIDSFPIDRVFDSFSIKLIWIADWKSVFFSFNFFRIQNSSFSPFKITEIDKFKG